MATVVNIPKDTRWGDIGQSFGEGLGGGYLAEFQKEEERRKQLLMLEWDANIPKAGSREAALASVPVPHEDDEDRLAIQERVNRFYPREVPEKHILEIPNEKDPEGPPSFYITPPMLGVNAPPGAYPASEAPLRFQYREAGIKESESKTKRRQGDEKLRQGAKGLGVQRYNAQTGRMEHVSKDYERMASIDRAQESNVEDEAARRAQNEIDWAQLDLDTKKAQDTADAAQGSDLFENAEKRNNAYVISSDLAGRADAPEFADIDKSHIPVPGSDEALMRGHFINSTRGDVLKVLTASQSKWFAGFGQAFAVENKQLLQEAIARTEGNMFFGVNPMPVGLAIREADAWATAKAARIEALGSVEAEKPGELTTFTGKSTEGAEDNPYQVPAEFSKSRAETLEWMKHNAETLRGKYFVNPETGQTTLLPEDLE